MSNAADMTKRQFRAACKRRGFIPRRYFGNFSVPGTNTSVSVWNAGDRRRDQLAYLIQEQRRLIKDAEETV